MLHSSENALERRDHHNDEDECAVERDKHVQRVRDVVAPPLALHLRLLNLCNGVLGLRLECIARISVALPSCQVLLLAKVVVVDHDLGALVVAFLRLEFIDNKRLCQQWIGQLGTLVLQIDEHR